jgi:hypothetical protein
MEHVKTYKEIRWFISGKLEPRKKKYQPEIDIKEPEELIDLTMDDIHVGLKLYDGKGEFFGTIESLDGLPAIATIILSDNGNTRVRTTVPHLLNYKFYIKK